LATLIAIIVLWDYDVTEEKANEVRRKPDKEPAKA
jgi:hypothetical protein